MLEQIISKVRHILKDAQQKLSVESAAAIEQVYNDIVALNAYINKELAALESNANLEPGSIKAARRPSTSGSSSTWRSRRRIEASTYSASAFRGSMSSTWRAASMVSTTTPTSCKKTT